jgi:hypothetical protein
MRLRFLPAACLAGAFLFLGHAAAAEPLSGSGMASPPGVPANSPAILVLHDGQFEPRELALPEGVKVKLVIRNQDPAPAEFESFDLSREVIVAGHGEATVYVGPLQAGTYQFFNDFNRAVQGAIVVKHAGGGKE